MLDMYDIPQTNSTRFDDLGGVVDENLQSKPDCAGLFDHRPPRHGINVCMICRHLFRLWELGTMVLVVRRYLVTQTQTQ